MGALGCRYFLQIFMICANLLGFDAKSTVYIDLVDQNLDQLEDLAINHAITEANKNASFVLKIFNATKSSDVYNYTASLLQRNVAALVGQRQSTFPVCAFGAMANLPMLTYCTRRYDEFQAPLCKNGLSLASEYNSYAHAVIDLMMTFRLKTIVVLFDRERFFEATYFQSVVQTNSGISLDYIALDRNTANKTVQLAAKDVISSLRKLGSVDAVVVYADYQLMQALLQEESYDQSKSLLWIIESTAFVESEKLNAASTIRVVAFRTSRNEGSSASSFMNYMRQQTGNANLQFELLKDSAVLVHDAITVTFRALSEVIRDNKWIWRNTTGVVSNNGRILLEYAKKSHLRGLSGMVRFDHYGQRIIEAYDIFNLQNDSFVKIGTWNTSRKVVVTAGMQTNKQSLTSFGNIEGRHLEIVTVPYAPFVMRSTSESGLPVYEGYCIDLLDKLAEQLRFTYKIYDCPDGKFGAEVNGEWNGMIREVMDKKADMAISGITVSLERAKVVKFTKAFMYFTEDMLIKTPTDKELNFLQFMEPFENEVWFMVLVCLFIVTAGTFLINYYSPYGFKGEDGRGTSEEFSWFNSLWFSLACMLQQGGDNTPKCLSGRVLAGCYWFCILVWVSTYTANLAAFFTVKNAQAPINNLEDLDNSDYQLSVVASSSTYSYFRSAEFDLHRRLWNKMVANKAFPPDIETAVEWVRSKDRYTFMVDGPYARYLAKKKPCDVYVASGLAAARGLGFALNLNEPAAVNISLAMLRLREAGYMSSLERKWWDGRSECTGSEKEQIDNKRIKFTSMLGIYIVLGAGAILGFITLGVEIWWHKKGKKIYQRLKQRKNEVKDVPEPPSEMEECTVNKNGWL